MSIDRGTRLGPYEIVAPLGAGGMGEVWRATDTRLDRSVAIKILPEGFAQSEELRARFEREAKTISSLNHPNICTLFDVGHENGSHFLVMELLEGESLADRLARGPLPPDQVLKVGAQVADALDRAHRQGIVHRDLKPGNVMITKSGAKLLDFGLARASAEAAPVHGLTHMPTQARPLTQEGTILGTFQYMAPEQLEGLDADARTDIFALGGLLYEMATGRRAFEGSSRTSLIAAIVSSHPAPISTVVPVTPPALDHVVRKCLEKDREDRWQSARDVASELRWISDAGSQAGVSAPLAARRKRREGLLYALVALLVAVSALLAWKATRRTTPIPVYRSSLVLPTNLSYLSGPPAMSPDGSSFVYSAALPDGDTGLWLRKFREATSRPVPGGGPAVSPFWSPDGRFIAYFGRRHLMKIPVGGGQPETLFEGATGSGGAWNSEGVILFTAADGLALMSIAAGGGDPKPVTNPKDHGHRAHVWPSFLPDQKHFLFLAMPEDAEKGKPGLWMGSLDRDEKPVFVTAADSNAVYVRDDTILFSRDGLLRAQRFDAGKGRVEGDPVSIVPVQRSALSNSAYFTASDSGALLFVEQGTEEQSELVWLDRKGARLGVVGVPGYYWSPRLSHDEKRVAIDKSESSGNGDIWILEADRPGMTRVTFDPANESSPHWRADDRAIYHFLARDRMTSRIVETPVTGGAPKRMTKDGEFTEFSSDLHPDGVTLIVDRVRRGSARGQGDLSLVSLATGTATPYLETPASEESGRFSPDGRWVAYVSDETGRTEVYVQSYPIGRGKWQISTDGGSQACWSKDGRELFFLSADRKMMSVTTGTGPEFEPSVPAALFPLTVREDTSPQFDVTRDGRILANAMVLRTGTPTTLISDWRRLIEEH